MENWGPYYMVPSECRKSDGKKVTLCESLDPDLLRQELITRGLPLEVLRVSNPWCYRKRGDVAWTAIGESDDAESNFPVEWDISGLPRGTYELTGLMQATLLNGVEETVFKAVPSVKRVRVG